MSAEGRAIDYCSRVGAQKLAYRIKSYWADRGVDIETRVEVVKRHNPHAPLSYAVRSTGIPLVAHGA